MQPIKNGLNAALNFTGNTIGQAANIIESGFVGAGAGLTAGVAANYYLAAGIETGGLALGGAVYMMLEKISEKALNVFAADTYPDVNHRKIAAKVIALGLCVVGGLIVFSAAQIPTAIFAIYLTGAAILFCGSALKDVILRMWNQNQAPVPQT